MEYQLQSVKEKSIDKGKRGVKKVVFGRTTILIVCLLVQLLLLFMGMNFLAKYIYVFLGGYLAFGALIALLILNRTTNPGFQLSWTVLVLLFPIFGGLLYLYVEIQPGTHMLRRLLDTVDQETADTLQQDPEVLEEFYQKNESAAQLASYMYREEHFPVYRNTGVTYFPSGETKFEEMLCQLRRAEKFIFLEYFIVHPGYMWDSIHEILKAKVNEGVEVRFLYDGMNELSNVPEDFLQQIRSEGIHCKVFSPVYPVISTHYNNRDHRKILVIDGRVAFTGGVNLADEYINRKERFGHWKDAAVMVQGDAVCSFTLMFLKMWNLGAKMENVALYLRPAAEVKEEEESLAASDEVEAERKSSSASAEKKVKEEALSAAGEMKTEGESLSELEEMNAEKESSSAAKRMTSGYGQQEQTRMGSWALTASRGFVMPYAADPFHEERTAERIYLNILNHARRYVHIMTPYLVPDYELLQALTYAAKRGVDVKLLLPHIPDKKYAFALAHSYYKYLMQAGVRIYEYTPGFVHSKIFVSDSICSVVGGINLDYRSLYLNFESAVFLYDVPAIEDIESDFRKTLMESQLMTEYDIRHDKITRKAAGALLKLMAPLM